MHTTKFIGLFLTIFILFSGISCVKENGSCFDESLYQRHKRDICPTNCQEVTGCDGQKYCNECEANKHGIRVR